MTSLSTNFVVVPQLPWTADASQLEIEGEFEGAGVYLFGLRTPCTIESISPLAATLRGKLNAETGARVTLELTTGQRPLATIMWVRESSFGVEFTQPIDVLPLINRNLVSQPIERRRMPRVELRCVGWLTHDNEIYAVTVRNISASGLQLEADALPPVGTQVNVYLEGLNVPPGELIWKREALGAIKLRQEIGWSLILPWLRTLIRGGSDQGGRKTPEGNGL
jgi:hypothetical protein